VYIARTARKTLSIIEKGHKVKGGQEILHKIADVILEMEDVGYQVTLFIPSDKGIRSVPEARQAADTVIENGKEPITVPPKRVRELSGVLCLVKTELLSVSSMRLADYFVFGNEGQLAARGHEPCRRECRRHHPAASH
jgi:hypothetical protein